MNLIQRLGYVKKNLAIMSEKCSKALKGLPKGHLKCYNRNGILYYHMISPGRKPQYLGRDSSLLVQKLKRRRIIEEILKRADSDQNLIDRFVEEYQAVDPNLFIDGLPKVYRDVPDGLFEEFGFINNKKWEGEPYNHYDAYPEHLTHRSRRGIMMRSKSEVICADIYDDYNVTIEYEKELILPNGVTMHPDFTFIRKSDNKVMIHEHCGMMDIQKYRDSYLWKQEQYINAGYIPFYDILFSFDMDGNVNAEEIERMICTYAL